MREIDPKDTARAMSYAAYIDAPMPMVTFFQTIDVTKLVRLSKRGYKFNMLMCWCIGCAANRIPEFKRLLVGRKMMEYDRISIKVVVANRDGGISFCDIPFCADLDEFHRGYLALTHAVHEQCRNHDVSDSAVVGTSALVKYDIDGVVNMYSGTYTNPFLIWGRYARKGLKWQLKLSFQFHHVQMDGEQAGRFLKDLQNCIAGVRHR